MKSRRATGTSASCGQLWRGGHEIPEGNGDLGKLRSALRGGILKTGASRGGNDRMSHNPGVVGCSATKGRRGWPKGGNGDLGKLRSALEGGT